MAQKKTTPKVKPVDPFRAALEETEGIDYAEAFQFKRPGDMITGKLLAVRTAFDANYKSGRYPVLVIASDDHKGEARSVHVFHLQLQTALNDKRPKIGDRVGIKRVADRESGTTGNTYRNYVVMVEGETDSSAVDWDTILHEEVTRDRDDDLPF